MFGHSHVKLVDQLQVRTLPEPSETVDTSAESTAPPEGVLSIIAS